ncbi:MAG: PspA/IM30 family protein [Dysgonomonas sp.]
MNIFKRLLAIGQAEIYSAVDKMEDPIHMTEQGIRELKEDLEKAFEALAQARAIVIRTKNEKEKKQSTANDFENKAILLMTKVQKGEIDEEQAENLAKEALRMKEGLLTEAKSLSEQQLVHQASADEIQKNIDILKFNITKWENELKTLKARIKISRTTQEVNKQMARMDNNSTIDMLERMKEKVEEEEALAQAYSGIAQNRSNLNEEIEEIIGEDNKKTNKNLDDIKRKLGML